MTQDPHDRSPSPNTDLDVFFDLCPDLLCILDADGRFLKASRSWRRLLGYDAEALLAMSVWDLIHPEDVSLTRAAGQVLDEDGEVRRLMNRYRHQDGTYRNLDWSCRRLGGFTYCVSRDVTDTWAWMKHTEYLSYHDSLTGLYNRRFLEEEIHRLDVERNLPISVVMGDIDRLKIVNDAFGHEKGDEFIRKAAEAIRRGCRNEDLVSRWGGDEFMVLLPHTAREDAAKVVERIRAFCAEQEVETVRVGISFGIATKTAATDGMGETMREAEDAMYRTKAKSGPLSRDDLLKAIAQAIADRHPEEKGHAERVGDLCARMGQALGLGEDGVRRLRACGLLHDIGKISVSLRILGKPGALTEEEWREMHRHPETGSRIVGSAEEMVEVGNAILGHHERWDGRGYPNGLRGESIPLDARVVALADSYATMTSRHAYRDALSREEAAEEIRRGAGHQFDPVLAAVFLSKVVAAEPIPA